MSIDKGVPLEVFVDGNEIVLKKYLPDCLFCGNAEGLKNVHGKKVCLNCLEELKNL